MVREAFLLAGGTGKRLIRDKRFIEFHGTPLYRHQLQKLSAVFENVALLCKRGEEGLFDCPGVEIVGEEDAERALLCGLLSGLAKARGPAAFFLGVDLPLMPEEALQFFRGLAPSERAIVPCVGGRMHFACALYPKTLLPSLEEKRIKGVLRLTDVFRVLGSDLRTEADLPFLKDHPRAFLNVNTPEDLSAAEGFAPRP